MQSMISFKDRFGFGICLNTDRIMTVGEDDVEGEGKTRITVDRNTQYVVAVPYGVVIEKLQKL